MENFLYRAYEGVLRRPAGPVRASTNTVLHAAGHWTPFAVRNLSAVARWAPFVFATLMYFGQPRQYFQYIPFFGRWYDPKGRPFPATLE